MGSKLTEPETVFTGPRFKRDDDVQIFGWRRLDVIVSSNGTGNCVPSDGAVGFHRI